MKIGILTFHRAHNYGAMLQAYALRRTLADMGHEAEFVDYRQPRVDEAFRLVSLRPYRGSTPLNALKILVSRAMTFGRRARRRAAYGRFAKRYLPHSAPYRPGQPFATSYDTLVFGSDQIWTTRFLGDFDSVLWGDARISARRKVAYAPSMEITGLTEAQRDYCRRHLDNFDSLSVREDRMHQLLAPLTERPVAVVADPTLLRDKAEYEAIAATSRLPLPDRYVLVYTIGTPTAQLRAIAARVAAALRLPVRWLQGHVGLRRDAARLDTAGPADFLRAFAGAEFVVTSSFHGTVFAVMFEKPFYSLRQSGVSNRAESLLGKLGLSRALISDATEADTAAYTPIDYGRVRGRIADLRRQSLDYLHQSL